MQDIKASIMTATAKGLVLHLDSLRDRILASDNGACFIEREFFLQHIEKEAVRIPETTRYSFVLGGLLSQVSTPIESEDVILGRVEEGRWTGNLPEFQLHYRLINSPGHMTLDWSSLLSKGLERIAQEARETAERLETKETSNFADNAEICCQALSAYVQRYVVHAQDMAHIWDEPSCTNLLRAANALKQVPMGPATDFFSALQSIWIVHLITSCYIGARDFAFGRMDQYLLPYYKQGLTDGSLDHETAIALLAHFLMKTNEITGTAAFNYDAKPIPSQSSKQYLMIGGRAPDGSSQANELSELILEAAKLVRMPQPVLTVRMDPDVSSTFKRAVVEAATILQSQIHFFNDAVVIPTLLRHRVEDVDAYDYTMVGCCRLDLGGRMDAGWMLAYHYHNVTNWLLATLNGGRHPVTGHILVEGMRQPDELKTFEDVLDQFRVVSTCQLHDAIESASKLLANRQPPLFHFESLLLRDCVERGRDCCLGGVRYRPQGHFLGGIATVANSLLAIKRLVFEERRFTLTEFQEIAMLNFECHEILRQEIIHQFPKYGNDDDEVDSLAREAGNILLDALDSAKVPKDQVILGGFYSLDQHHNWGRDLPATPDGRFHGESISENQSPVYGTDIKGITALLKSVVKLPLHRTVMGGLNIKFGAPMPEEKLAALLDTYFRLGGLHIGFTFIDRETLIDAQVHPERYRTLCVRLYGFSEYFVSLSLKEQQELIDRTEYKQ